MKKTILVTVLSLYVLTFILSLASCKTAARTVIETETVPIMEPTTAVVAPIETLEPTHTASGLVFTNADGTWWINRHGELELLINKTFALLSPDKQLIVYIEEDPTTYKGDLWVMNLVTGDRRNITQTPDRAEDSPAWLSGQTDILVFGSDTEVGMGNSMFPTLVRLDGSGYQILDQDRGGYRGVSPDGSSIVYGGYEGTALISILGSEPTVFDPAEYGLRVEKLFQPAWSPDGQSLAWFVAGDFDNSGRTQLAIAVFDLKAMSAITLHPYEPIGGSMFINDLTWSPNGEWLAFTTYGEPPATGRTPNLWIIRPNGSDQAYIGEGSVPVWRFDGQYLAFQDLNQNETEEVFLVDASTWKISQIEDIPLPERIGFLMEWVVP